MYHFHTSFLAQLNCCHIQRKRNTVQIKIAHMLLMPVLLLPLPAQAQCARLLRLLLLRLPRHGLVLCAELQLSEGPFVLRQPSQLQPGLRRPLPTAVQRLLFRRLRLRGWPVLLPRRPRPVPVLVLQRPAASLLQVPVGVLRGGAVLPGDGSLLPRPPGGGAVVPGVLLRLRVLLPPVQGRVPVPAVR